MEELEDFGSIAIIGMSGRFPGAANLDQFWDNLLSGKESIRFFDDQELANAGVSPTERQHPHYVPASPTLEGIDQFDAAFFSISPREAKQLAPSMRLFLECVWEAFENGGYTNTNHDGQIGVYAGANLSHYWRLQQNQFEPNLEELLGNDKDYLATHISYKLNLKGPSVSVQTACSTSLVAINMACQALLGYQCDLALAGGAAVRTPHQQGYQSIPGSILSPDGHCRPFDANAQGTIFGSGVGVVLLKRLDEALRDGDHIRAVIKGSAINNDGASKVGFTAPSVSGQSQVVALAQAVAEVSPDSISYIEAHGTGTPLGDPIEVAALTKAFRAGTDKNGFCAMGSVKSNVGHLETAAGVAGLIKTVLALENQTLPPSLNFKQANPEINFTNSPFYINTQATQWPSNGQPRRAGVSSFGMGGTNAHIILEQAPEQVDTESSRDHQLLTLSARTPAALQQMTTNLAAYLSQHSSINLADVAYTLSVGRQVFNYRQTWVANTATDAAQQLQQAPINQNVTGKQTPSFALLFSGQVSTQLSAELYAAEWVYKESVDECGQLITDNPDALIALQSLKVSGVQASHLVNDSEIQSFVMQYALAQLVFSWGVQPNLLLSSGTGHYVAACLSGVLSLEGALKLHLNKAAEQPAEVTSEITTPWFSSAVGQLFGRGDNITAIHWQQIAHNSDQTAGQSALTRDTLLLSVGTGAESVWTSTVPFTLLPTEPVAAMPHMLKQIGLLWQAGIDINWGSFYTREQRCRIPLPTYPFERQRFWVDETERTANHTLELESSLSAPAPVVASTAISEEEIRTQLQGFIGKALHLPTNKVDCQQDFLEMGADSLVLMEAIQAIEKTFDIRLSVRQVFESLSSIDAIVGYIQIELDSQANSGITHIARQSDSITTTQQPIPEKRVTPSSNVTKVAGPSWKVVDTDQRQLSEQQQLHLDALIDRYTRRTAGSKQSARENRVVLADVRTTAGFQLFSKEMLYPIVVKDSRDGYVWDVDDNQYIDITMGFGVYLFGHKPEFLTRAMTDELTTSGALGPETLYTGEVARLIQELSGVDRVAFFNTGTEAMMTILRLVRARAGRNKIVMFKGSYHGHSDGTLGIGLGSGEVAPLSGGVPADTLQHMLILDYGSDESLEIIQAHMHELAAVFVEPVQSRFPNNQPREYLHKLRAITRDSGVALVFDEMITGFRISAGGAQQWYDIDADLVAYGKVVGGGLPIGVVAGKREFMDYLDGGQWDYGDQSYPNNDTIFYAGTFNKNPWTMAAARSTLQQIKQLGPSLFENLNNKTAYLAKTLNDFFDAREVPMEIVYFASLFRFSFRGNMDLFFYQMIEHGIYIWEGRNCFLCHAHTESDIEQIIDAVKATIIDMQAAGFITGGSFPAEPEKAPDVTTVQPTDSQRYALSEAQHQLWLLAQLSDEGLCAYNIYLTLQLDGPIQSQLMEQSIQQLMFRHKALRTVFDASGEYQRVLSNAEISLQHLNLDTVQKDQQGQYIQAWFEQENQYRFNLNGEPLLRAHLFRLSDQRHLLIFTTHHIVGDGISINVIVNDLLAIYQSTLNPSTSLTTPATQYHDYIQWLALQNDSQAFSVHEQYWLQQLSGPLPVLDLPLDHPRPPVKSYVADVQSIRIGVGLTTQLRAFSRTQRSTLFMTSMAAYLLLLHRLSGQDDIIVGVPTTGRAMPGSESMVGYCTHLLPIRSRLTPELKFNDYLNQIKQTLLAAFEHQDYPYAQLLDRLNLPRDLSRSPLVATTFNMDQPPTLPEVGELAVTLLPAPISYTSFDMGLNITDLGNELVVECKYHTSLFQTKRMAHMLAQYQHLLAQLADNSGRYCHQYSSITPDAWARQPNPSEALAEPYYPALTQLIFEQAESHPERLAISDSIGDINYSELIHQVRLLATQMQQSGVKRGDVIVIPGPANQQFVAALLAVWQCHAICLTLDIQLPLNRQQQMLHHVNADYLLHWDIVPEVANVLELTLIDMRSSGHIVDLIAWSNPTPNDAAYIFYTSGSTGVPKAIIGQHKSITHFVEWQRSTFEVNSDDRVAQLTSLSFDALLRDIGLPLISGASLHIPSLEKRQDEQQLLHWFKNQQITVLHSIPSRMQSWLKSPCSNNPWSTLRLMFFSGERLSSSLLQLCRQLLPVNTDIINLYGSTETTMTKCFQSLPCESDVSTVLSAFQPMADTQILVMSDDRLCGVGELGEIVIRTPFRTLGYFNPTVDQPAAFTTNPFSQIADDLLYRSGDLGRYQPDGNVLLLGRMDDQVKINGVRIEPAEVKAAIDQHPGVSESYVTATESLTGTQLNAYLVGHSDFDMDSLRQQLSQQLPLVMLPASFLSVEVLPRLPSGKVDRHALPDIKQQQAVYQAPTSENEKQLATLWAHLLEQQDIGISDNFFALGGNSLTATRMVSAIRRDWQVDISLAQVFTMPTIKALALSLEQQPSLDQIVAEDITVSDDQVHGTL